jgi:hypothetical protein
MQGFGREAHLLQGSRAVVLDQDVGALDEAEQQFLGPRLAKVERQALLVACIRLPEQRVPRDAPVAQRVALARVLDLDHLGAEIGQLQREHVARDQTRQIEHGDSRRGGRRPRPERGHQLSLARYERPGS